MDYYPPTIVKEFLLKMALVLPTTTGTILCILLSVIRCVAGYFFILQLLARINCSVRSSVNSDEAKVIQKFGSFKFRNNLQPGKQTLFAKRLRPPGIYKKINK